MNKIKTWFKNLGTRIKPYIGYIGAFLGGILGFLFLRRKKTPSVAGELEKQQEVREDKADEIMQETGQILQNADDRINAYQSNNSKRWEEGKYE